VPVTRVAGIDCGTNSIRLLVADVDDAGRLTDVDRRMEVVRLGQGVDRTGRIAPEAMERTLEAARRYAGICADLGTERIRFVATSASRDAQNRQEFVDGVRAALGVQPEVIGGEEEARLSFHGATSVLAGRHPGPFLVVDIGGSSCRWRSVRRTHPTSSETAATGEVVPSTSSVEPPPMSTTRNGPGCRPASTLVAPLKDSRASSSPPITSGCTPTAARTPSTNSCRFCASREAEVATNLMRSVPRSAQMPAYRRAASSVRSIASGAIRPVRSTP